MKTIYDTLLEYCKGDVYPFHMPGHKRQAWGMADPFLIDITEIDGFDNLHHAEGILREAQQRAAQLYGAKEAFYLINGSTAGILAGISAALHAGDSSPEILFARNAHKAAYHALYVNRAKPVWLYPDSYICGSGDGNAGYPPRGSVKDVSGHCINKEGSVIAAQNLNGRIDPRQVERALEDNPQARAVFITSPTYDGVVSDVREIARIAHERGIPLVVDQAHGAHFGMHPKLPQSASRLGADITITSLHKTLPSLTQTGLLLLGGDLIRPETVRRFLAIYQSSSPSYVLMAGIDRCVSEMSKNGEAVFDGILSNVEAFRQKVGKLRHIFLLPTDDPTRILVSAGKARWIEPSGQQDDPAWSLVRAGDQLSGRKICDILRARFHIETEMDLPGYVLCLVGAGDTAAGFDRLYEALAWIDARLGDDGTTPTTGHSATLQERIADAFARPSESVCPIHEAWDTPGERVPVGESAGRISADFAYLYPPGMPLVIPGERISAGTASLLKEALRAGFTLSGMEDLTGQQIRVLRIE